MQHDVAAGRAGRGPDREDSDALPPNPPGAFGQNLRHALGVGQQVCLISFSYFILFPLLCLRFVAFLFLFLNSFIKYRVTILPSKNSVELDLDVTPSCLGSRQLK